MEVDPDRHDKAVLDAQEQHWQTTFVQKPEMFGGDPSGPAVWAVERFKEEGKRRLLELGCGQGRDTLFFGSSGFHVTAADYSQSALDAVTVKARSAGLSARIDTRRQDIRDPLPFPDGSFDGCYSHMLYCMALTTVELERLSRLETPSPQPNAALVRNGRRRSHLIFRRSPYTTG